MEIRVCKDKVSLGKSAAEYTASLLNKAIEEKGSARIILSSAHATPVPMRNTVWCRQQMP